MTADEIASEAEFFSFGTNDLTQMTYGYSRDDAGKFLQYYVDHGILDQDPFVSIDQSGVGELVKMGVKKGRSVRKDLKVGICGEHGGEPASVIFCHNVGLDYVSCSPYRVPIARLAAAQAEKRGLCLIICIISLFMCPSISRASFCCKPPTVFAQTTLKSKCCRSSRILCSHSNYRRRK